MPRVFNMPAPTSTPKKIPKKARQLFIPTSPVSDDTEATVPMERKHFSTRLLSISACKRIIKTAGKNIRYSDDLNNPVHNDKHGTVHKLFKDNIKELTEKAIAIMRGQRKTTLLPRHIHQLGLILGIPVASKGAMNLPLISVAPVVRYLKQRGPPNQPLRLSKESVQLLIEIALDRTVLHIRSASGLAAVGKRSTIHKYDIDNASLVCNDFPRYNY